MLPQVLQLLSSDDVERWRWSERKAGEVSGGAAWARQPPRSASEAAFPQNEVAEEGEAAGKLLASSPPPEMKEGRCNEQVMQMKQARPRRLAALSHPPPPPQSPADGERSTSTALAPSTARRGGGGGREEVVVLVWWWRKLRRKAQRGKSFERQDFSSRLR